MKLKWCDKDFEQMGWHDSALYSISFPFDDLSLKFDIDYIMEWKLMEDPLLSKFYICPCSLVFKDVLNLRINMDFENNTSIYISEIERKNPTLSPNKKSTIWNYIIITDQGDISFTSTGFEQRAIKTPIWNDGYALKR
ncbi:hypothetical protein M2451_002673 [Dysgonomonas sp. PFB1-18]|uniref:hypothetical protein n=1 Tax=unclassified Dysgonomonas TaxID=2630389 RepID=UPI0024754C8A|nr:MULTISPECIES: hypothetical protein [unclassified Dysgonomonas]MDH6309441.1 hypothetical protein [Dysgonomonas sp. PF1-14]MDH6339694.1 hypothetical protein [Dysgonomonas sp. PF1-16]MDH6381342.1 hypothetical protein [Dysgonomonas sp. PFB1-18]MDH6398557.1 hypothetical protein [Dysgonomonas sp. PF1-23]